MRCKRTNGVQVPIKRKPVRDLRVGGCRIRSRDPATASFLVWAALLFAIGGCGGNEESSRPVQTLDRVPLGTVQWKTWADRTIAREVDKPLLIYLYNRRSIWCHRLAAGSLSDPTIEREIRRVTVPVAVDVDARPDLAERFSLGAWPSLAVYDLDRGWVTGTTYIESDDLEDLLRRVSIHYDVSGRKEDLERARRKLRERRRQPTPSPVKPTSDLYDLFVETAASQLDEPGVSPATMVLLAEAGRVVAPEAFFDRVLLREDGLFSAGRRSVDGALIDDEVTLAQNAALLSAAVELWRLTDEPQWADRARALAVGIEGLARRDGRGPYLAAGLAGFVTPDSVFSPSLHGEGGHPSDDRMILRWNASAVSALIGAEAVLSTRTTWRPLLDRVLSRFDGSGRPTEDPDLLADAAMTTRAALDAYEATGERAYRLAAVRLIERAWNHYLAPSDPDEPLRIEPWHSAADRGEPGVLAVTAAVLVRLEEFRERAERVLSVWVPRTIEQASGAGTLGLALRAFMEAGP